MAASISADGRIAASGGEQGTVQLWDITTGKEILLDQVLDSRYMVQALQFSADGRRLAAIHSYGFDDQQRTKLRVWDTTSKQILIERQLRHDIPKLPDSNALEHDCATSVIAPNCEFVVTNTHDKLVIESIRSGSGIATVQGSFFWKLVFAPDSAFIAASQRTPGKGSIDGTESQGISVFETLTGQEVQRTSAPKEFGRSLCRQMAATYLLPTRKRFSCLRLSRPRRSFGVDSRLRRTGQARSWGRASGRW